uniref:Uncharacterized protein n=1 Tax=Physcomitrium patens TaxID=3218 RepID=A0A2K1KUR0_PHYPA|nr:hypothetical protein PHYPA_004513 [Physcomitrium patens]
MSVGFRVELCGQVWLHLLQQVASTPHDNEARHFSVMAKPRMEMIPKASDFCDAQAISVFRLRLGVWGVGRREGGCMKQSSMIAPMS